MTGLNTSSLSPYVRLILFTHQDDKHAIVTTKRETAEYFGWLDRYETYEQLVIREAKETTGRIDTWRLAAIRRGPSGTRIRISRADNKGTYVARKTHSLSINSRVTNIDLAELAAFAKGDWFWMEARNGARIDKDEWLRIYTGDAKIPRKRRTIAA